LGFLIVYILFEIFVYLFTESPISTIVLNTMMIDANAATTLLEKRPEKIFRL